MLQESIYGVAPAAADGHVVNPVQQVRTRKPEPAPESRIPQNAAGPSSAKREERASGVRNQVSLDELAESLRRINLTFDLFEIAAEYSVSEKDNQVHVTVRNTKTGEVIRRIPPEEFLSEINDFKNGLGFLVNRVF